MAKEPVKLGRSGPRLAALAIAAACMVGLAVWWNLSSPVPRPVPSQIAALPALPVTTAPTLAAPPPAVPPVAAPSFDIVRVNPQGSAVIAGRAAPDSVVTLQQNGKTIGQAKTDGQGQFVVLPDKPLAPGGQELTLQAKLPGQTAVAGNTPVMVVVPPPAPSVAASATPSASTPVPPLPVVAVLTPSNAPPILLQAPAAASGTLAVGVVDYDSSASIRFSGTAPPDSKVRVYVDNNAVGETQAGPDGRWALTPTAAIPPGAHKLRLDQIGPRGQVLGRAELPFQRAAPDEVKVAEGQVVVQPGESLWRIARNRYGQGVRYTEIFAANSSRIRDPDLIYPGQVFVLPSAAGTTR